MKCPYCGQVVDRVIDSKTIEEGIVIYRRRECLNCTGTFTTFESMENQLAAVLKKVNEGIVDRRRFDHCTGFSI